MGLRPESRRPRDLSDFGRPLVSSGHHSFGVLCGPSLYNGALCGPASTGGNGSAAVLRLSFLVAIQPCPPSTRPMVLFNSLSDRLEFRIMRFGRIRAALLGLISVLRPLCPCSMFQRYSPLVFLGCCPPLWRWDCVSPAPLCFFPIPWSRGFQCGSPTPDHPYHTHRGDLAPGCPILVTTNFLRRPLLSRCYATMERSAGQLRCPGYHSVQALTPVGWVLSGHQ